MYHLQGVSARPCQIHQSGALCCPLYELPAASRPQFSRFLHVLPKSALRLSCEQKTTARRWNSVTGRWASDKPSYHVLIDALCEILLWSSHYRPSFVRLLFTRTGSASQGSHELSQLDVISVQKYIRHNLLAGSEWSATNWTFIVPLEMKGCICHFTKWQIHPFISKVTIYGVSTTMASR